jgi:hypothetical protein
LMQLGFNLLSNPGRNLITHLGVRDALSLDYHAG